MSTSGTPTRTETPKQPETAVGQEAKPESPVREATPAREGTPARQPSPKESTSRQGTPAREPTPRQGTPTKEPVLSRQGTPAKEPVSSRQGTPAREPTPRQLTPIRQLSPINREPTPMKETSPAAPQQPAESQMDGMATMYMRMPMSTSTLPVLGTCKVDEKKVTLKFPFTGIEFELPNVPVVGCADYDFRIRGARGDMTLYISYLPELRCFHGRGMQTDDENPVLSFQFYDCHSPMKALPKN